MDNELTASTSWNDKQISAREIAIKIFYFDSPRVVATKTRRRNIKRISEGKFSSRQISFRRLEIAFVNELTNVNHMVGWSSSLRASEFPFVVRYQLKQQKESPVRHPRIFAMIFRACRSSSGMFSQTVHHTSTASKSSCSVFSRAIRDSVMSLTHFTFNSSPINWQHL